tara:strand:+ start:583 stop:741 length:159 start_codon:yes stop_codon:yes gene_type:complete
MAKKKGKSLLAKIEHESRAKFKKTSIGRRKSRAMMNKSKRRSTKKKYRGQGK